MTADPRDAIPAVLRILDDPDDYPVVLNPTPGPLEPALIYDGLIAEQRAIVEIRAMCAASLKSRSPKEAAMALRILAICDTAPPLVALPADEAASA